MNYLKLTIYSQRNSEKRRNSFLRKYKPDCSLLRKLLFFLGNVFPDTNKKRKKEKKVRRILGTFAQRLSSKIKIGSRGVEQNHWFCSIYGGWNHKYNRSFKRIEYEVLTGKNTSANESFHNRSRQSLCSIPLPLLFGEQNCSSSSLLSGYSPLSSLTGTDNNVHK